MSKKHKILITGGTGLVGQALSDLLISNDHSVVLMSRSAKSHPILPSFRWNIEEQYIDPLAFEGVDTIVHLAGAGVADKRWTAKRKEEILTSRTESSQLLFEYLKSHKHSVKTFIAASAIGIYGSDTGDKLIREEAEIGKDFLAKVTESWEESTRQIDSLDIRLFQARIGIVLSAKGGALKELLRPPIAAPLGSGSQFMSWIHIKDLCRLLLYAIENESIKGFYNAVGPHPLTNKEFTQVAAKVYNKPYLPISVPSGVLRLMMGEMAEIVLGGSKVSADKILDEGFSYHFPDLESALQDLKSH